jgi:hypothetical protein
MRPSTASPMYLYACSQRILGVVPCLAPRPSRRGTATPTARDSNPGSRNHDMSRLSTCTRSHTRTMRPSTASPMCLCACSQRILGVVPSSLALALDKTRQHVPLLATQTPAVVTTTCMSRLSGCTRIPGRCAHPRPHRYTSSSLPTGIGRVALPRPSLALDKTRQHVPLLATQTSAVATKTCLGYLHSHT